MLPGDVLLITAFISYVGCFTKQYRLDLLQKMWLPFLKTIEVGTVSKSFLLYTSNTIYNECSPARY